MLARLDQVIEICKSYVDSHSSALPELDSLLAQYLIINIAGTYEEFIEDIIKIRSGKLNDPYIISLLPLLIHRSFRNPDFSKICSLLKDCGESVLLQFKARVNPDDSQALDILMKHRHDIAHGKGASVTIRDVLSYYSQSINVIRLVHEILSI
jgi:hypothetical protein